MCLTFLSFVHQRIHTRVRKIAYNFKETIRSALKNWLKWKLRILWVLHMKFSCSWASLSWDARIAIQMTCWTRTPYLSCQSMSMKCTFLASHSLIYRITVNKSRNLHLKSNLRRSPSSKHLQRNKLHKWKPNNKTRIPTQIIGMVKVEGVSDALWTKW